MNSRPTPRASGAAALLLCAALTAQSASFRHPDGTTHWYRVVDHPAGLTWDEAHRAAATAGGYLATITSFEENELLFALIDDPRHWTVDPATGALDGPWIGGVQETGAGEPAGGWRWSELDPFAIANWANGQPDNRGGADRIHFGGSTGERVDTWADAPATHRTVAYVVELSGPTVPATVGVTSRTPGEHDGYVLVTPLRSRNVYLVDRRGRVVHSWSSRLLPGLSTYLLPDGNLLRTGAPGTQVFLIGGVGGTVEEYDWDGRLRWQFTHSSSTFCLHHDVEKLPNGNVLMISWELFSEAEAIAAGRDPALIPEGTVWPDKIIEVDRAGAIVWEWHAWDHLIQDRDPTKANYGNVALHPELVDINYVLNDGEADWMHSNAVDYHPDLDQVMLSVRSFDELWIIDHSTTTAEARGHTGGRSGRGGDLLYRWGNPQTYRAGTAADQQLFKQHDARWIEDPLPGGGNILVFNNGTGRPGGDASTVDEIDPPPVDRNGNYRRLGQRWGPPQPLWTYAAPAGTPFYSRFISGAERLANGNTLICAGWIGVVLEVTPRSEIVWSYTVPERNGVPIRQGDVGEINQAFRAPYYPPGYPGLAGKQLAPGRPIEIQGSGLLLDGSTHPTEAATGSGVALSLFAEHLPARDYLLLTSLTPGLIGIDTRALRVGWDPILQASISGLMPAVFQNYAGSLDDRGTAVARLAIPPLPALAGASFHTAFVVLEPSARSGIGLISNTVVVDVTR